MMMVVLMCINMLYTYAYVKANVSVRELATCGAFLAARGWALDFIECQTFTVAPVGGHYVDVQARILDGNKRHNREKRRGRRHPAEPESHIHGNMRFLLICFVFPVFDGCSPHEHFITKVGAILALHGKALSAYAVL